MLGFVVLVTNAAFEAVMHALVEWVLIVVRITYWTVVQGEVELVLLKDINAQLLMRWICFAGRRKKQSTTELVQLSLDMILHNTAVSQNHIVCSYVLGLHRRAQEKRSTIELVQRNEEMILQIALKKHREREAQEQQASQSRHSSILGAFD